jgi:hypothetical protein
MPGLQGVAGPSKPFPSGATQARAEAAAPAGWLIF